MDCKIIVAAHKPYDMPKDEIYFPLHVGAAVEDSVFGTPDNTGDNISEKNAGFCELTGLYWAWKNLSYDVLGLVHYRRYFTVKSKTYQRKHAPMDCVLTGKELQKLLRENRIIVTKKRRYYIETLYSHYDHTHYAEHLDMTREVIVEKYPDYLDAFDCVMRQRYGYMFNMFIMERELADSYCSWLFDILFELESRIGEQEYSSYQARLYGRVGELLLNVWLEKQGKPFKEIPYIQMEHVDRLKKGRAFLQAKFRKKKYEESF